MDAYNRTIAEEETEAKRVSPLRPGSQSGFGHWRSPYELQSAIGTMPQPHLGTILVTGATGYIGGLLVPMLLERGYRVRAMARAPLHERLNRWPGAEIAVADALDLSSLEIALRGVHTAYYLIHSLLLGPREFAQADVCAARNFREAAERAGVRRIIYLGALADTQSSLSLHLRSRLEVAETLRAGSVPVTVLRAAMIIGAGSASYEIVEHLVKKCPILMLPRRARHKTQPVAIHDVMQYLIGALEIPETEGRTLDVCGEDVLSYREMMEVLANLLGKKRFYFHFRGLPLGLYGYLISLLTPVPAAIARSLIEGLRNDTIIPSKEGGLRLPLRACSYREALVQAMSRDEQDTIHTRWSDAYPPAHELAIKLHELPVPPAYSACYSLLTRKSANSLFHSICRIGGRQGWFHNTWMWRWRGMLDRVLMGVGSSRGRRSRSDLNINDVIDFWRVEDLLWSRRLLLRAEMKLPGRAWLEFTIAPEARVNRLSVHAYYDTHSPWGRIYWYACLPLHHFIFTHLIEKIESHSRGYRD